MNLFSISKIARSLAIFTLTLFVLGSCEKKENTIGSGFLDGEKFGSGIYRSTKINAYTKENEKIRTSGTSVNLIGAYQDVIFGMTKSSFGIQVSLSKEDPDFGTNPIVDSVVLTMPYLGREVGDSIMDYNTDSIFGNNSIPMSFKISQLTKFLHPDSAYYSTIDLPTSDEIFNNPAFVFSPDSIVLTHLDTTDTGADTTIVSKIAASFRQKLDNNFFQQNILDLEGSHLLESNSNFITNHINGFVFETESTDGAIYTFNMFKNTSLMIYYKNDDKDVKGNPLPQQEFELDFSNILSRVNKYEFDRSAADPSLITQLTPGYDGTQGSDFLYIQGMSGLESNVELFTDKVQLDTLREENWLINRAELVYRVSDDNGNAVAPPFRLMLANSDSLDVAGSDYRIIDYIIEPASFDGYLRSDATILTDNTEKRYYKFRITNHVSAILDGEVQYDEKGDVILDDDNKPIVKYDDNINYKINLISFSGSTSVSRAKIHGTNNTIDKSKNLFLEIHYSKKDL